MFTPTTPTSARHNAHIVASQLSVIRGSTRVLHRVNLTVTSTSRIALVGENGRGKTTLLRALAGRLHPDEGVVERIGSLGLAEQEMSADDHRTVGHAVAESIAPAVESLKALDQAARELASGSDAADRAYSSALERAERLDAWDGERRVQIALESLDAVTDPLRRLAELSVGQRYRVRLACLLGATDDFLFLDEPTNHLDRSGLDFLSAELTRRAGGVVVVTHDRALLADVADTIVDLDPTRDGLVRITGAGYDGYRDGRRAERERWEQEYARQQAEQSRLHNSLTAAQNRLESGWRPEKGTNKHGRATRAGGLVQSVHRRQEQLASLSIEVPVPPQRFRFPEITVRAGTEMLGVAGVRVEGRLMTPVSFSVARRDRLVVTGPNGSGESTLLRVASGDLAPQAGHVRRAAESRIVLLAQESALPLDRRAADLYARHVEQYEGDGRAQTAPGLAQLGLLRPDETKRRIGELSMGQRRRLDLALVLAVRPQVLLLDEPTNHLSMTLVDELTEALGATDAAVVVSTHDRQFLRDTEHWPRLELGLVELLSGARAAPPSAGSCKTGLREQYRGSCSRRRQHHAGHASLGALRPSRGRRRTEHRARAKGSRAGRRAPGTHSRGGCRADSANLPHRLAGLRCRCGVYRALHRLGRTRRRQPRGHRAIDPELDHRVHRSFLHFGRDGDPVFHDFPRCQQIRPDPARPR